MTTPHVVLVSHDASRTGAPLLLLDLVRWLVREGVARPSVVCLRGGSLEAAFAAAAPTTVVEPAGRSLAGVVTAGLAELGGATIAARIGRERIARAIAAQGPADLLWLSAAPSLAAIETLGEPSDGPGVVAHVHELGGVLGELFEPERLTRLLRRCDSLVVGAEPVAAALRSLGCDPTPLHVLDEFIPEPPSAGVSAASTASLRSELGITEGAPVVGAIATAGHRKGIDMFPLLGRLLADRPPPAPAAHLVWVGGSVDDLPLVEARSDARLAGLADRIHFVGEQADLEPWFALFDVLALTSREDSFPLVCLHAGVRSVPVVAFDTGIGDLLRRAGDGGSAIAHLDLPRLADRIAGLLASPDERAAIGRRLSQEVRSRHLTEVGAPALWAVMETVLAERSTGRGPT